MRIPACHVSRTRQFLPGARESVRTPEHHERQSWRHHVYKEITNALQQHLPEGITHGVCIEPTTESEYAHELMLRVWRDPVFGPVIGFGERARDADYWPDRAVFLPPLNAYLVSDLIKGTRAAKIMAASDDMPAARIDLVEDILLRISEMICELPWIRSIELNPLRVDERQAIVVDARIEIGPVKADAGRYEHMAIHPYPERSDFALAPQGRQRRSPCTR